MRGVLCNTLEDVNAIFKESCPMRTSILTLSMVLCSAAASAQDAGWTGAYGGLSMATNSGSHEYNAPGDEFYDLEGPAFGAFGGYNWAYGNLIFGVEGAATFGGVYEVETDGSTSYKNVYEYDRFLDLKGRVGYAVSDFLVYGTLGISSARFRADIGDPEQVDTETTGMLYGVGADYSFGDRYFAGGEIVRRSIDFFEARQADEIDAEIDTFTLRVGMKF
jgi:Outer membrane protein beta-barrel domain